MSFTKDEKTDVGYIPDSSSAAYEADFEFAKEGYDVDRSKGGSTMYAYYNVVCIVAGTGLLGLSRALSQGGWAGLVMLLLAWWMSSYTAVILQTCMYKGKHRRLASYKEVATEAFGAIGGWISFFFSTWIYIGTPLLYTVLSAANINQLCEGTAGEIGTIPWTIIFCGVIGIPYIFLKSMNNVAWTSFVGIIAIFGTIIITMVLAGIDAPNHVDSHKDNVIWDGFPIALATISFSFGGSVAYPNMEAAMKNPKRWPLAVVTGLATCAVMYIAIAVCGYYIYGNEVVNPVYNSVPPGAARTVAIVFITFNILVSAPILLVSFALDVEDMLNVTVERLGKKKEFIIRLCLRTAIMVFIGVVGIVIPFFDLLMSLIGAFANCLIILVFPVLFYWRLTGFRNKKFYILAWHGLIILVGLVGLIFGTWTAIEDLIDRFGDDFEYSL
ncbi:transmembrane amino acid transporter protein-domain-containing protein [Zychaea mexicana]|uniref:transmembrane amino acid transporter protein-domain-containing protein n=1 Tax=Zychaea mexicana TaxID=64656 RepID=UPI0022FDFCDA|nr:transmembrane amino acid transporter protein-domain-containing protein [Zychaea mexicana]KAI9488806.1 transmembrane amino acid transporter protein-domain-containing protein [Zychaea mexicana]